jgi:hypothetical protein
LRLVGRSTSAGVAALELVVQQVRLLLKLTGASARDRSDHMAETVLESGAPVTAGWFVVNVCGAAAA